MSTLYPNNDTYTLVRARECYRLDFLPFPARGAVRAAACSSAAVIMAEILGTPQLEQRQGVITKENSPSLEVSRCDGILHAGHLRLLLLEIFQGFWVEIFLRHVAVQLGQRVALTLGLRTIIYGVASIMKPAATIIMVIGFESMLKMLNDSGGVK